MDHLLLFNRADGLQQAMPISATATSYSLLPGTQVLWNTVTDGPMRWGSVLEPGVYTYPDEYDQFIVYDQVGMWVKRYGPNAIGQDGAVPFIDSYVTGTSDYIPEHWQWLLDHYRKAVPVYALKGWLFQEPGTAYADANAAIEATYASNPLNRIRWEEREFVPFGGVIFNLVLPFLTLNTYNSNYEIFHRFREWLERDYNDSNEDDLPG